MLMIDMRNSAARMSLRELTGSGRRFVSNPIALSSFMAGVRLTPAALLEDEWQKPASAAGGYAFFRTLMHGTLPRYYDVRHLEHLGGRFALRVTGAGRYGDYTVVALNRRIVTLAGLPLDEVNDGSVIDVSVRADAFLALWNDMLAQLAEATLAQVASARARRRAPSEITNAGG